LEVASIEGLCEDIGCVFAGADSLDIEIAVCDQFTSVVIFDSNVLNAGMPHVIFSESGGGVVITEQSGRFRFEKVEP
jgi:hypothetical protein